MNNLSFSAGYYEVSLNTEQCFSTSLERCLYTNFFIIPLNQIWLYSYETVQLPNTR